MNNKKTVVNKSKKGGENMKRSMIMSIVGAIMMVLGGSGIALAALSGSSHDLTGMTAISEICEPCHTPHNALQNPYLWNHAASTAGFTLYTSPQMNVDPVTIVGTNSEKCLACHDGVTALDAFGGSAGGTVMGAVSGNLGTDLTDDHPVGISYLAASADPGIYIPGNIGGSAGPVFTQMGKDDILGCPSCHEVHNSTPLVPYMLRTTNVASALCLDCHNK